MPGQTEKPTLDYAIVCEDVRFEAGDKISLMGLFDAIAVQGSFPTVHPRLAVVVAYTGVREEVKSEIQLVDPGGSLLRSLGVAHIQQQTKRKGARHIAVALNVPFKASGIYQIKFYLDEELVRSIGVPVESSATPQTGFGKLGQR